MTEVSPRTRAIVLTALALVALGITTAGVLVSSVFVSYLTYLMNGRT